MNSTDPFDLGAFTTNPDVAWTLPAPYYYNREIYDAETQHIFSKSWRLAGHVTQLKDPGDYVTENICGNAVFVVRAADGELHAFHNVCRHRAHRLLAERSGNVSGAIRCPYHGWTYGLTGALLAAKHADAISEFKHTDHGLVRIRVEIFCGFVFVNLCENATSLALHAPGFESTLRRFVPDLDRMVFTGQDSFDIGANWKVVAENSIDWYHVYLSGPAHRAFGKIVDRGNIRTVCRPNWIWLRGAEGSPDNGAYDFRLNAGQGQTSEYVTFFLWPDLLIFTYPHVNAVWTFLMAPSGPERTREEIAAFTPDGVQLDAVTEKAIDWMGKVIGPEDVDLNVGVQQGLHSDSYTQGRLLIDPDFQEVSEHGIHYFQTHVLESLGRLPRGSAETLLSDESELDEG